ncbi:hypothetical protein ID866_4900 [Astraeus odoratus]|nr:hypothetical protein ID866_4900 [Astraeus odoratus]
MAERRTMSAAPSSPSSLDRQRPTSTRPFTRKQVAIFLGNPSTPCSPYPPRRSPSQEYLHMMTGEFVGHSSADVLQGPHSTCAFDDRPSSDPLLQCDQCPPRPQECMQAACPIPEMTAECTDQCLVVACDDPDHPSPECQVTTGDMACDGSCVTAANCLQCPPGLEEIFQCCQDYHPYLPDPRSYDTLRWENSFSDILCGCKDDAQVLPQPGKDAPLQSMCHASPLPHPLGILRAESSDPSSVCTSPSPLLSASPHSPISTASQVSVQSSVHAYPCKWADCGLKFASLTELVGHVNLQHLRAPGFAQPDFPVAPNNTPLFPEMNLSCHWGNCAMYPSPASIPSSSSGQAVNDVIDLLTAHLMQDHLGVNIALPAVVPMSSIATATTTATATPSPAPVPAAPPASDKPVTPSPGPAVPECHTCKWEYCSQTFDSSDKLTNHIASMHVGSGKAHYDCFWEGCTRNGENGFSSKQKISRHLQSHTGHRPFQCNICLQNFSEAATLQQHMRRHTQEKPYVCDYPGCGKAFAITGALTIHKRTHNGQRPFKCSYCDKAFSESSNLSKHLRTHTGARPYPCMEEGCKKSFARPDQLARHMGTHRKKDSTRAPGATS